MGLTKGQKYPQIGVGVKKANGEDFYKRIGALGGKNGHTGGFYADRELASRAGRKGGAISRRGKATYER